MERNRRRLEMEIRRSDEIRNLKEELKKRQQRRTASNPYSKKEENKETEQ